MFWLNQPNALTEIYGNTGHRAPYDLTNFTQARMFANVTTAGASGAKLGVQYSTDNGSTWAYLDQAPGSATAGGPSVDIGSTGLQVSSYVTLNAGAKASIQLRVIGVSGDGSKNPAFGVIGLQVK
jgi:hypothetical protein